MYFRPVSVLIVVLSVGTYPSIKGLKPTFCLLSSRCGRSFSTGRPRSSLSISPPDLSSRNSHEVQNLPCFANALGCCVHWQWGTDTVLGLGVCLCEHVTEKEGIFQKIVIVLRCTSPSTEASANVVNRPCPKAFVVAIPTRTNSLSVLFVV